MWRGFYYYRSRMNSHSILRMLAFGLLAACLFGLLTATARMKPILESLATARVSNTVTGIVTQAVYEAVQSGEISYDGLITFEKDNEGRITALYSNMASFSRLQAEILDTVLERVGQVSARDLSIPVGSLTGSTLLAGRGPAVSVRMESVGSSSAYFENEFISAGINQTRHNIVLHIDVYVSILLPGFTTATKVSNGFTVAETVIVGSVPDTYANFNAAAQEYADDAKNYILNGN